MLILHHRFQLTEIMIRFKMKVECQNAFDTLKSKFASSSIVIYPDFKYQFRIHCDASSKAIDAVLSQMNNNLDMPIAFTCIHLSASEKSYATSSATKVFHDIIYRYKTIIVTNHDLLQKGRTTRLKKLLIKI